MLWRRRMTNSSTRYPCGGVSHQSPADREKGSREGGSPCQNWRFWSRSGQAISVSCFATKPRETLKISNKNQISSKKKVKFSKLFANLLRWSLENFEKSADLGPLPAKTELLPVEIPRKLVIFWKNFEKLAKKGQILQTFCQNNEKFREKKSLLPVKNQLPFPVGAFTKVY